MPKIYIKDEDGEVNGFDANPNYPVEDYFEVVETVVSYSDSAGSAHKTQLVDDDGGVVVEHNITEGSAKRLRGAW